MTIKTHPCDLAMMTAEQAWENIAAANERASKAPKGYHRNHWLEIAKRSADVWFERMDNRLCAKHPLLFRRHDLDHTARGQVR